MIRVVRNLLLLVVICLLALPAAAHADPISDCGGDGKLDRRYSNGELRDAIDNIPSDLDEYSNCRQVFRDAISSGSDKRNDASGPSAGASDNGGDGGSVSPDEQKARDSDNGELAAIVGGANDEPPSVNVDGQEVEPGSNGLFDLASASNDIPVPLLVALIAVGLLAILGGFVALRERVPALARIPLLSKIPRVSLPRFRR